MKEEKKEVTILGSTGSIGSQTLDVIKRHGDRYRVRALTAGSRWEDLARQALEYRPSLVVIADEKGYLPSRRLCTAAA